MRNDAPNHDARERIVLCEDPYIYLIDDFADETSCERVIDLAKKQTLAPAEVESMQGSSGVRVSRTGTSCWLCGRGDALIERLEDRVCAELGVEERCSEYLGVVRYGAGTGERYAPHLDAFDAGSAALERGGQRLRTGLLYLSDVDSGGATSFPTLGVRCRPRRGRLGHRLTRSTKESRARCR